MKPRPKPTDVIVYLLNNSTIEGVLAESATGHSGEGSGLSNSVMVVVDGVERPFKVGTFKYIKDVHTGEYWTASVGNIDRVGVFNPIDNRGWFWWVTSAAIDISHDEDDGYFAYVTDVGYLSGSSFSWSPPRRGHSRLNSLVRALHQKALTRDLSVGWYNTL